MLKKTITYTDYDGNERTEDFYFNLSRAEVTAMEMSTEGGIQKSLGKIISDQDGKGTVDVIRNLILTAYGEKSLDGKRFIKSPELSEAFSHTEAFSDLFMELLTDADLAAAFVNGILPSAGVAKTAAPGGLMSAT